jgi:hypothetical protein
MGGQACVVYGAAEFSRDTDFVMLAEAENLERFKAALRELEAERIAVPDFKAEYLSRGHAVHFRCGNPDVAGLRIDVMSKMRGVDPFDELWARQVTITDSDGNRICVLSLPDLVKAKKTQRAKDWPMIQRLVEVDYLKHRFRASNEQIEFWFRELRSLVLLVELCAKHPALRDRFKLLRPLLAFATEGDIGLVDEELAREEKRERDQDREYWEPLRKELEAMRHEHKR